MIFIIMLQSSSKKNGNGRLLLWLVIGSSLLVTDEILRSIEESMDDFVIGLALFIAFLVVVGVYLASN